MKNISDKSPGVSAVDDCAQAISESWQRRSNNSLPDQHTDKNPVLPAGFEFREVTYGSDEYKITLELRHRILREPLGLDLWHENLSVEINQRHFTLWHRDKLMAGDDQKKAVLVACLVIVPLQPDCVKLRQMAVNRQFQRQGLGQLLIRTAEDILITEGVQLIELHARETAVAFYQGSGYQRVGPAFVEVGLAHQRMTKQLQPHPAEPD